jgi:hypothetical protein
VSLRAPTRNPWLAWHWIPDVETPDLIRGRDDSYRAKDNFRFKARVRNLAGFGRLATTRRADRHALLVKAKWHTSNSPIPTRQTPPKHRHPTIDHHPPPRSLYMLDSLQLPEPTRTLPATPEAVTLVPVNRIEVLNSRERNSKIFNDIVENIRAIGLKKPITVTKRPTDDGEPSYLLVCGEGRLNAFRILGQSHIPALVVDVSGTVLRTQN